MPQDQIKLALGHRASKVDIDKPLAWLASNVTAQGRIYFFFSGHGAPLG
ncbi:MAG: hypothetical protein HY744_09945 [Deltaproteobacteria bacterium]|nr:hypothetical protein [Deltaproteobacteria bacterium]